MKILLDENFPLRLARELRSAGFVVEHIIELGLRGSSDEAIIRRLAEEPLLFLTQDLDFLDVDRDLKAIVVVSHLPQRWRIQDRTAIWRSVVEDYLRERPAGRLFEIFEDGRLLPVRTHRLR